MMADAEIKHKLTGKVSQIQRLNAYLCYPSKLQCFRLFWWWNIPHFQILRHVRKSCVKQKCLLRVPMYCLQTLDLYKVFSKIKSLKTELKMWNYKGFMSYSNDPFWYVYICEYIYISRSISTYIVIFIHLNLYIMHMQYGVRHKTPRPVFFWDLAQDQK